MPNQRDVAELAGVSSASVSRYLQDPSLVRGKTGRKIEEAIRKLNYRIDVAAQTLKTGKTYHVGILSPGMGPYYWMLFQALQLELAAHDYHTTILYTKAPVQWLEESRNLVLPYIRTNRVEGFVFLPTETDEDRLLLEEIRRHHEKIVLVDAGPVIIGSNPDIPNLAVDNYRAGRRAADLFWAKGHRKFLHIAGDMRFSSARLRRDGFVERLLELGGAMGEENILPGEFSAGNIEAILARAPAAYLGFTAVFSANDAMALAFMHACRSRGLNCPGDYELIGFDNNIEYTPYTLPSISTFEQPLMDLGRAAASALLEKLEGGGASVTADTGEAATAGDRTTTTAASGSGQDSGSGRTRQFEARLIVRDSFRP